MTYEDILERVYETFKEEVVEIADYRPYIIPNSVVVWLTNGDRFIYIAYGDEKEDVETGRREGHWILVKEPNDNGDATYECSECHCSEVHSPKVKVTYCWNCGAKMKREDK